MENGVCPGLGGEAAAQVGHDLLLDGAAGARPAARPGKLHHAGAQAPEAQHPRGLPQLAAQLRSQPWKEEQLAAPSRFAGQTAQVRLYHA